MPAEPYDPTPGAPAPAGTLRHLLRTAPRVAPTAPRACSRGIARAAAVWHARGQAHGALTPERVLVGAGDLVTLAPPPRQEGAPAPWPTYLAPEQIDGRAGDARSDVYALGLVGWEMLAGQQPWEGESLYGVVVKQREQDLPRLSTLRPGLPRALVVALEGCLHKAAGDRWQTMAEFLSALEPVLPAADVAAGRAIDFAPRGPFSGGPRPVPPAAPAGPVAGAVARAAAAGAVPGTAAEPRGGYAPADRTPPLPPGVAPGAAASAAGAAVDDRGRDPDAKPRPPRRPAEPGRRGRWLAGAVLGLALAGAAAAAVVVVRGRDTGRATRGWLDSLATTPGGGADVGAAAAATTRENTTAVPVRRSSGPVRAPAPVYDAEPGPGDDTTEAEAVDEPPPAPVLQPTPPLVPPRTGRPVRPTVPRPDTASAPDSLLRD
jgi:hypothetical protein